jgi:LysM repeat protein
MALASQVQRADRLRHPSSRRSRRRRSRLRFIVGLLLIAVLAFAGWRSVKWWSNQDEQAPGREQLAANETAETSGAAAQRDPVTPPPLTLTNPSPRTSREPTADRNRRATSQEADAGLNTIAATATRPTEPRPTPPVEAPRSAPATEREQPGGGASSAGAQSPAGIRGLIARAEQLVQEGKLVDARAALNRALHNAQTAEADRERIRAAMTEINQKLVFEPVLIDSDPFMRAYQIQSGDSLWKLARRSGVYVDENFLMRINGISSGGSLRLGQTIKIPTQPFHAVVHKPDYRMDLYMGEAGNREGWMYVRSFPVGLGEYDSTPAGSWVVTEGRKTVNPDWRNPRTGEYFRRDDPENPIGEYWIALTGTDANTKIRSGYGIHGTVEPDSIGRSQSMGCVRMLPDDIERVYGMLAEGDSTVWIVED